MSHANKGLYEFDKFRLDVAERLLSRDGERVPLPEKAFETLCALVRRGNGLVGKEELLNEIWADAIVEENNIDKNISLLRQALGERSGKGKFIETVRGHGYRFVPEVRPILDFGLGIADTKPEETVAKNESQKTENRITNDPGKKTEGNNPTRNSKSEIRKRKWLAAFAILSLFALGAAVFYLWRGNEKAVDAPIKTVAVLPFKPLVVENRNEALELGMADALISKLSGSEEIVVRPLSAIRRYNAVEQDALTAGHELGVDSILDGSIQTWGNRIRVSAKLLRTSDGKQLWAGQFDEEFTDIFVVQDAISGKAAAALKIRLGGQEKKHSTENVEAYQLYMKGLYHIAKLTPSDIQTSIPYFQQAIDIDPGYALAYTRLTQAYGVLAIGGAMLPAEAFPKAKAAGKKAIEIDDTLDEAHNSRSMQLFWHDWDWPAAEKECLKAIELNPNNGDSHGYYATILSNTGRHAEALAEMKRSRELNPLHLAHNALEGQFLLNAGRADEALIHLQKTSELEPNFWMPHSFAASAYIELRMYAEAITESRKEFELSGGNDIPFGTYALAKSGKRDEARAALENLLKLSATKYVPPYNIALIYHALGETGKALEWLEKGYEQRDPKMTFIKVEPKWNTLRNEPRFVDLMKRMDLQ
jgi:DNA-binding winged helix-turn-helix (wHTH) protein/TolB-like protein/Flp pilus assembly protein TadD